MQELNRVGGVAFAAVFLLLVITQRRAHRFGWAGACAAAVVVLPAITAWVGIAEWASEPFIKHAVLWTVVACAVDNPLPGLPRGRARLTVTAVVLSLVLGSFAISRVLQGGRQAGLFPNPNNLALMAILMPVLMLEPSARGVKKIIAYGFLLACIFATDTSGALLGFGCGLIYEMRTAARRHWIPLTIVGALIAAAFVLIGAGAFDSILPDLSNARIYRQIAAVSTVSSGTRVTQYYSVELKYGVGSTSGLWRVAHWRRLLGIYADAPLANQLFGLGLNSASLRTRFHPHNDYLRLLFEQGLVGLLLALAVWVRIARRSSQDCRPALVMLAVYCISENNLDNFLFFGLFVLIASSRAMVTIVTPLPMRPSLRGELMA